MVQRSLWKRKWKDCKNQRGSVIQRKRGFLNTAGPLHGWTLRNPGNMTGPSLVKARRGPSTDGGSGHKHTPPQPRNHLHLITIYKWNISFLQRCFSGYTNLHEPWRPDPMPRSRRLTQKKFSVVMRLISLIMICLGISFLFCYRSFAYTSWFLMLHFYGICVFANICVSEYICVTFALSLPLCFFHLFV